MPFDPYNPDEIPPVSETDPNDTCPAPVFRQGSWMECGWPCTDSVVYAGLPAQRFCSEHVELAQPRL